MLQSTCKTLQNLNSRPCLEKPHSTELCAFEAVNRDREVLCKVAFSWITAADMCVFLTVSKSYLPAGAAGKETTVVCSVGAVAACWCRLALFVYSALSVVCLSTQPGVSHPGSGPHGRRDAADWSQRVFPALPGVRLHHHAARWHVRETLCAHMHQ